ncbi:MAG: FAD-dependent oxidoreductase [Candidatus Nitrosocosmicus sp.]|nr:FAD-dependent oxidoreductase [Candidatus Nitrosocosmicus sp.]
MSTRPSKLKLELLDKISHAGSDIISFKFARSESQQQQQQDHLLNYKAGQYAIVDLGTKEDPEGPMRSFTLSSSPTEEGFIMISTRIRDTPFKKKLAGLNVGSSVIFTAPLGKFTLHEDHLKPAVLLSGGIGVTPFRSMIKYVIDAKIPLKITMFDANRNKENILFKDEFDKWAELNENVQIVYTLSDTQADWNGEQGHINKKMITKYLTNDKLDSSVFYICGPPSMLKAMEKLLQEDLDIPKRKN